MANDQLKKDLQLSPRSFDTEVSDRQYVDLALTPGGDLKTVQGQNNLAQAIINRLLTRKGELTGLGHPGYGSRLHELIGEPNNLRLRARAELYIRDCLAQEPRIKEITYVQIEPPSRLENRERIKLTIGIQAINEEQPFSLQLMVA